jgi:uncharacterized NAD(P)/FAD-binding protein YdhS
MSSPAPEEQASERFPEDAYYSVGHVTRIASEFGTATEAILELRDECDALRAKLQKAKHLLHTRAESIFRKKCTALEAVHTFHTALAEAEKAKAACEAANAEHEVANYKMQLQQAKAELAEAKAECANERLLRLRQAERYEAEDADEEPEKETGLHKKRASESDTPESVKRCKSERNFYQNRAERCFRRLLKDAGTSSEDLQKWLSEEVDAAFHQ